MGNSASSVHLPVLLRETIQQLQLSEGLTVLDGTVGAGGHSVKIMESIGPAGKLIGLDRDQMMLNFAKQKLEGGSYQLFQKSYAEMNDVISECHIPGVDRILLDLGLSSDQLADDQRGFSFDSTGPLDLRFDITQGKPAWKILEKSSEEKLEAIFHEYGEERYSKQIAQKIVLTRNQKQIQSAKDLSQLIQECTPRSSNQKSAKKHPATRVFQALRIAANQELEQLDTFLNKVAYDSLNSDGLLAIISFHSLEDRMVKNAFRDKSRWKNLTSKPIIASPAESRINPRARSAKLRIAIKV
jgi:16S rRNA (cytosine1402-N4)-methyltransferase